MSRKPGKKAASPPKKPPRKPPKAPPAASSGGNYEEYKKRQAAISAARSAKGRDIGDIPPIADPARRERCRDSLRDFCLTYNPEAFYLDFSGDAITELRRIEEAVFQGAMYAFAEPRGSGKTTRCRMAILWAAAYAHKRYPFLIGATDGKARDTLEAVKKFIRFLPLFAADFPEISYPATALAGIANRASGQTCGGEPTMIQWSADRVHLPTVPPPPNWPKTWTLRSDGAAPTSGVIIGVSGLTGEGIRGSLETLTTGEQIRPDFVLIDDPQTAESARSKAQNETRYRLIMGDVLGMAGPGRSLSCVMPCTVIARGDFIDRVLDRKKHPLWRGERTKLLRSMPSSLEAWQQYFDVFQQCALYDPPDFTKANEHYLNHREALDAGAEASWPERKLDWELSAIQHAMHLYCRDRAAFMAEYQNDPEEEREEGVIVDLEAAAVAERVNGMERGVVPPGMTRLVAFSDVQENSLWWVVLAVAEGFAASAVVDYGVYPKQPDTDHYFTRYQLRRGLKDLPESRGLDESARIYAGARAVANGLLSRSFPVHGTANEMKIDLMLMDSRAWTGTIHQMCRESQHGPRLRPSMGYGIGASALPMANWPIRDGEQRDTSPGGAHWVIRPQTAGGRGQQVVIDTNYWKSFLVQRLLTGPGGRGAMMLFGKAASEHRIFADHLVSEYRVETEGRGRKLSEWKLRPERPDNDWFDALVGCVAAASVLRVVWSPSGKPETKKKPVVLSMKDMAEKAAESRARPPGA